MFKKAPAAHIAVKTGPRSSVGSDVKPPKNVSQSFKIALKAAC